MKHESHLPTGRNVVCIAENRATCEPALRILIASLNRLSPDLPIILFCPDATVGFAAWTHQYSQCFLNPYELAGLWTKYDIKPLALLTTLRSGAAQVIWLDSDIVVARDIRPLFDLPENTVAVTEEALSGGYDDPDGLRARMWGYPVGRVLPFAANTAVIRLTQLHCELLELWNVMLQTDTYRKAQEQPWFERPLHVQGDQEVFTALLSSDRFSEFPIHFLRRGRDIIQFFGSSGYTLRERLNTLIGGLPMFVHSQGFRPWWPAPQPSGVSARLLSLYNALSPYTQFARQYGDVLEDPTWLRPSSLGARLMTTRHPALTGLPVAILADIARFSRTAIYRFKQSNSRSRPTGSVPIRIHGGDAVGDPDSSALTN